MIPSFDLDMEQWRSPGTLTGIHVITASDPQLHSISFQTTARFQAFSSAPEARSITFSAGSGSVYSSLVQFQFSSQPVFLQAVDNPAFLLGIPWIHRILDLHSQIQIESRRGSLYREFGVLDTIRVVEAEISREPRLRSSAARVYSYPDPDTGAFRCVSIVITAEGIDFDEMRAIEARLRSKSRSLHHAPRVVISVVPP